MDENQELHPVLDQVPALELDCGGLDLLNSKETQLHYAAQVGVASPCCLGHLGKACWCHNHTPSPAHLGAPGLEADVTHICQAGSSGSATGVLSVVGLGRFNDRAGQR